MFINGKQSWNKFVIKSEKSSSLKNLLIDELDFSTRSISRLKRDKNIYVNGKYEKTSYMVSKGDIIEILIVEEESNFRPQDLKTTTLYEDFDVLVEDKPSFMVVHPTKSHFENTLANSVTYKRDKKNENCKIRFVNRLDMNTSGIVIVAKNAYAHHKLSMDMSENKIEKEYIAVVDGIIEEKEGIVDAPIYRGSENSIKRTVDFRGQSSRTYFKVIEKLNNATVLRLKLETGRTHQIRVHMAYIGHGIIGDELYGVVNNSLIDRQALHACRVSFYQPRERYRVDIESKMPADMLTLTEKLGGNINDYK